MNTRHIIAGILGLLGLVITANSSAITFVISNDFPKHFYCHFRAYRWHYSPCMGDGCAFAEEYYNKGGWSSKHHAGSTYRQDWGVLKVITSCFDDYTLDNILPTGHICYSFKKEDSDIIVNVTHAGSHILFNGKSPESFNNC